MTSSVAVYPRWCYGLQGICLLKIWFTATPAVKCCFIWVTIWWKDARNVKNRRENARVPSHLEFQSDYMMPDSLSTLYCFFSGFKHKPECFSSEFLLSGSSDIQEDHSEKQCQEEEAVWGIHWNTTVAYVTRGYDQFCPPELRSCSMHLQ